MENFKYIIFALLFALVLGFFLYMTSVWGQQSYENNQHMMQEAKKMCHDKLIFFTEEHMTNHPIIVCSQK
jgi:hypothetical protein